MQAKYKNAIFSGIIGAAGLFVLIMAMMAIFGRILGGGSQEGYDIGPAGVGSAMMILIVSVLATTLIGAFSVWRVFRKVSFTLKDAMEVSAVSGVVSTLAICLVIFAFAIILSTYAPSPGFSPSRLLSTLNSGLSICCILVFVIGIVLSIMGGLAYSAAVSIIRKRFT